MGSGGRQGEGSTQVPGVLGGGLRTDDRLGVLASPWGDRGVLGNGLGQGGQGDQGGPGVGLDPYGGGRGLAGLQDPLVGAQVEGALRYELNGMARQSGYGFRV